MITWMQKHKKWLVITIWVSTIAFVGAGFVGWGSYDYGKSAGSVAVVGDREISVEEYQREYSNLYEQYQRMLGDQFNQDMAKQLKLSDAAYNLVIQKNLILAYGDELGLDVTKEDIARELVGMNAFLKDGKFDKPTYVKVLTQNRTNPVTFEAGLKRNLLLEKIQQLFQIEPTSNEVKNLSELLFLEDEVEIKILEAKNIVVPIDDEKLKKYWETNKNRYMTSNSYELQMYNMPVLSTIPADEELLSYFDKNKMDFKKEDGKLKNFDESKAEIIKAINLKESKKEALRTYLKIKKGDIKFENTSIIDEDKLKFSDDDLQKLRTSSKGSLIKPILVDNEYIILRLINKIAPKPLSYELAQSKARVDYVVDEKKILLALKAVDELKNFKGTNLGYVSRESFGKVTGLNPTDAAQFLSALFSVSKKEGQIELDQKTILYKIKNSRFTQYDAKRDDTVKSTLSSLQNNELMTNLVKRLENRYDVQTSMNTKE